MVNIKIINFLASICIETGVKAKGIQNVSLFCDFDFLIIEELKTLFHKNWSNLLQIYVIRFPLTINGVFYF